MVADRHFYNFYSRYGFALRVDIKNNLMDGPVIIRNLMSFSIANDAYLGGFHLIVLIVGKIRHT